jgi:phosphatidylserine/phosphatidylglycerophosphate/cardiolipin synthase-like enzyme
MIPAGTELWRVTIGYAITHANMIVVDSFDPERCTVVTGSHNFSVSASEENDENVVVVRGTPALAQVYVMACYTTYAHYRWRAYLEDKLRTGETPWSHLAKTPAWQDHQFTAREKTHLGIWCPRR